MRTGPLQRCSLLVVCAVDLSVSILMHRFIRLQNSVRAPCPTSIYVVDLIRKTGVLILYLCRVCCMLSCRSRVLYMTRAVSRARACVCREYEIWSTVMLLALNFSDCYDFFYYPSFRLAHILRRTEGVVMLSAAPNSGQKGLLRARLTRRAVEELHELQASGAACGDPGFL